MRSHCVAALSCDCSHLCGKPPSLSSVLTCGAGHLSVSAAERDGAPEFSLRRLAFGMRVLGGLKVSG